MEVVIPLPENFSRERKIKYSNRAVSSASNMSPPLLWKKKNLVTLLVENSVFGQFSNRVLWFLDLHLVVFPSIFSARCIYIEATNHTLIISFPEFDHFSHPALIFRSTFSLTLTNNFF